MPYQLHLVFEELDAFRAEFERNIAMGGAFIPTGDPLELRSFLEVVVELSFCGESVVLEAEVVHRISPERALNPGDAGVAVSFRKSAKEVQAIFRGYLEETDAGSDSTDQWTLDEPEATADDDTGTQFDVSLDDIETAGLSAIEASVVELAQAGLEVARILEIIPKDSVEVHQAIDTLVERGVLKIRRAEEKPT